jgi:hypothetical protein
MKRWWGIRHVRWYFLVMRYSLLQDSPDVKEWRHMRDVKAGRA